MANPHLLASVRKKNIVRDLHSSSEQAVPAHYVSGHLSLTRLEFVIWK